MTAASSTESPATHQFPLPKILEYPASTPPCLITQGAEGRLYKTTYLRPDVPCALKYRPPKPWRHPILDQRLTKHRILSEARILAKCRRDGVRVPAVYAIDESAGWLMLEWIQGTPVRVNINERLGNRTVGIENDARLKDLMRRIGVAIGNMHKIGIVHGDLTTSNMMLRPPSDSAEQVDALSGEIVIIDLGLASGSIHEEDRAVDLYVLERAFGSTHPRAECLFGELLDAYRGCFKQAATVLRKLEDVRMRGRKRSMLG
ncbi:Mn2+-dependent serine/threonine protein kinase [Metarhizium robertsii]|uniref:EKC/KEOPS complex subunit BUD32 n=2 Tax=Metarhizium robertsii TaxID=568076 RepID=E9F042_METRA|nr:Tyrosine-protein kinase, active site protein [Metarhizium robertsii ARSEF 23]EFY98502.1 Tyrosine-protein kinase, active site protein [Metarhizium robertsii ARSEF 23]EXV04363.1 Mn2+-dependent serine/threonine protein kinase [Metarhizium robertsii]